MSDWLTDLESTPDWHSLEVSRLRAAHRAKKLLGARPWTEPLSAPVPDWLIPGLLQRESIHMIASEKGCGKTWLGLSTLLSGLYGTPLLGATPPKRFSTVYVAADSPNWDIGQQLRKLLDGNALRPDPDATSFILPYGVQFTNEEHVKALSDLIVTNQIDHLAIDVKLYTHGTLSENDDAEQMLYYRVIKMFRDKFGIAVTLFHHFAKTTGKPRGAGTSEQAAEHSFFLTKDRKSGIVTITRDKIRGDESEWEKKRFILGRANGGRRIDSADLAIAAKPHPDFTLPAVQAPVQAQEEMPPRDDLDLLAMLPASRPVLMELFGRQGKNPKWVDNKLASLKKSGKLRKEGSKYVTT